MTVMDRIKEMLIGIGIGGFSAVFTIETADSWTPSDVSIMGAIAGVCLGGYILIRVFEEVKTDE